MAIDFKKMKDKLESADNNGKKTSKDNPFFKPEMGSQEIRFLPSEDEDPFKEFHFHYNIGNSVLCPKKNYGEHCPICDYASNLWKEGTDESKNMAKKLFARQRFFSTVVVRGKEAEGPKPYGYGRELYKKLIMNVLDPDIGDITDIDNGRDVRLDYAKSNGADFAKSDITVKPVTKPLAKSKKEIKDLLEKVLPLESFFERKTPQEVRMILEGFMKDPYADDAKSKYGNKKDEVPSVPEIGSVDEAIDELNTDD